MLATYRNFQTELSTAFCHQNAEDTKSDTHASQNERDKEMAKPRTGYASSVFGESAQPQHTNENKTMNKGDAYCSLGWYQQAEEHDTRRHREALRVHINQDVK